MKVEVKTIDEFIKILQNVKYRSLYKEILNSKDIEELEKVIIRVNNTDPFGSLFMPLRDVNKSIKYNEEQFHYLKEEYASEYVKRKYWHYVIMNVDSQNIYERKNQDK